MEESDVRACVIILGLTTEYADNLRIDCCELDSQRLKKPKSYYAIATYLNALNQEIKKLWGTNFVVNIDAVSYKRVNA